MKITLNNVRRNSSDSCYVLNITFDGGHSSVMVMPVDIDGHELRPEHDLPVSLQETLLDLSSRQQAATTNAIETAAILLCRQFSQHKVRASITLDLEF